MFPHSLVRYWSECVVEKYLRYSNLFCLFVLCTELWCEKCRPLFCTTSALLFFIGFFIHYFYFSWVHLVGRGLDNSFPIRPAWSVNSCIFAADSGTAMSGRIRCCKKTNEWSGRAVQECVWGIRILKVSNYFLCVFNSPIFPDYFLGLEFYYFSFDFTRFSH